MPSPSFAAALPAWLLALVLAGCQAAGPPPAPDAPRAATGSSLGDVPDPFVLVEGTSLYVYATNGQGRNVQLLVADAREARPDGVHPARLAWTALPDALPVLPSWARGGSTWAPEVVRLESTLLLYYTARDRRTNRQCIGVALGTRPEGPFADARAEPLLCQEPDGTIDASPLLVDGRVVLYVKSDGNCCGRGTALHAQALTPDGLALDGPAVALLRNDPATWEGDVVEAPTMLVRGGRHVLFYSGNAYAGGRYGVGAAVCDGAFGPCRRLAGAQPLLRSRADSVPPLDGPGHQALFRLGSVDWIAYHAWEVTATGGRGRRRFLHIDRLDWPADGVPVVRGPTPVP
jgi:hypothetical protein